MKIEPGPRDLTGYVFPCKANDHAELCVLTADDGTTWVPLFATLDELNAYIAQNHIENSSHRHVTDQRRFLKTIEALGCGVCIDLKHENGNITFLALSPLRHKEPLH